MARRHSRFIRRLPSKRQAPPSGSSTSDIILFDDFNGSTLNTNLWNAITRDGDRVNGDANVVRAQNAIVTGGCLEILCEYIAEGVIGTDLLEGDQIRNYASAQVLSRQSFLYGKFEARIQTGGGTGVGPLLWLLADAWKPWQPYTANDADHELWPSNAHSRWEIDALEQLGGTRTKNNCAVHCYTTDILTKSNTEEIDLPFNSNSGFMVYGLEWRQGFLRWTLDAEDGRGERELRRVTTPNNIPTTHGYIQIHAEMGAFYGTPSPGDYPVTGVRCDWIRIRR